MLNIKDLKVQSTDSTIKFIKNKFTPNKDSDGISAQTLEISLLCPLSKKKMKLPCRAIRCKHLQCFEASFYIEMNRISCKWDCPLCDRQARYEDLVIDGLLMEIFSKVPKDCNKVQFNKDGSWGPLFTDNTQNVLFSLKKMSKKRPLEIILDDIPNESKTLHDISQPIEVKKRHAKEKSFFTFQSFDEPILSCKKIKDSSSYFQSKSFLAESNASIGSKPIENEAYSSHPIVSSSSHSNLQLPVIDLEVDEPTTTSTISVASSEESGPNYRLDFECYLVYLRITGQLEESIPSNQSLETPVASASYQNLNPNIDSSVLSNFTPVASVSKVLSQNSKHVVIDLDSDVEIID